MVYEPPPPATPEINGNSVFYFSGSVTGGSGQITAIPGTTVTVTVTAGGPPPSSYFVHFGMSGVLFSDGTNYMDVTNTTQSKTFVMPASGYVNWSGYFTEPNSDGAGSIRVQ